MTGNGRNKLRTYKLFKSEYGVENYCKVSVPFNDRSAFRKRTTKTNIGRQTTTQ
jgi:hypothetical protein